MKTFALTINGRVQELIEAESKEDLLARYHKDTVAKMVDVTDRDVKQNMVESERGVFTEPPRPIAQPSAITAERLLSLLITKGVLSADDLKG